MESIVSAMTLAAGGSTVNSVPVVSTGSVSVRNVSVSQDGLEMHATAQRQRYDFND